MMSGRPPRGLPPLPGQGDLDHMNVDFLLPTGMLITLTCHKMTSLADIKTAVWQEARNQPLFDLMKDQGFYSFLGKLTLNNLLCLENSKIQFKHVHGH